MVEETDKHHRSYQLGGISFTYREFEVLSCITSGRSSRKSIANILKISPATVATYMRLIMQKLQCSSVEHVLSIIESSDQEENLRAYFHALMRSEDAEFNVSDIPLKNVSEGHFNTTTVRSISNLKRYRLPIACLLIVGLMGVTTYLKVPPPPASIRSEFIVPEDKYLLKRQPLMTKISKALYARSSVKNTIPVVTLVGIGGVGKTTLARMVAKNHNGLAWEINAESTATLRKSLRELAFYTVRTKEDKERMDFIQSIPNEKERSLQTVLFIKDKLRTYPTWLLIYDNVENLEEIKESFPFDDKAWGHGNVIITTRNENIKMGMPINIDALNESEMIELFQKTSHHAISACDKKELHNQLAFLKELPPYPLDISIAGKYLNDSKSSYKEYLVNVRVKTNQKEYREILADSSNYTQTRYDIIDMSLTRLIKENPLYTDLLLLLSRVDSQNIPIKLCEQLTDKRTTQQFIRQMKEASLLTIAKPSRSFDPVICLHRSIQTCITAWLKNSFMINPYSLNKFYNQLILRFEAQIHEGISSERYEDLHTLLPHLGCLVMCKDIPYPTIRILQGAYGCLLACLEIHTDDTARYLKLGLETSGDKKDYRQALIQYYYGYIVGNAGQYAQSIYYLEKGISILKEKHYNCPEYFNAIRYLSLMYRSAGRYTESKQLMEESKRIKELYPKNYRSFAESIAQEGLILRDTGHYKEALRCMNDCVNMLSAKQGAFRTRFQPYYWLSTLYMELGYFKEALKGYEIYCQSQISSNPNDYFGGLKGYPGVCYYYLGEYDKALNFLENSYINDKKTNYIYNYNSFKGYLPMLGRLYIHLGHYDKAKSILQECLSYCENLYGKNAFQGAKIICYLGELDMAEGNLGQAEKNMLHAYRLLKEQDHTDIYVPLESLAELNFEQYKKAKMRKDIHAQETFYKKTQSCLREASAILQDRFPSDSAHVKRIREKVRKYHR